MKENTKLTSSDWYKIKVELNVTTEEDGDAARTKIKTRVERANLDVDWERSWRLMETRGLCGDQKSFPFEILHNILPTNSRLFHMNQAISPDCNLCDGNVFGDLKHELLECSFNGILNDWIPAVLMDIDMSLINAELTNNNILTLNLEIEPEKKLAVVWFLTTALKLC